MPTITGTATGWAQATYDLSAYAGQSAKLRFRYENGDSTSAGWGFDSLTIGGASGPVFSDDAETLKPDWSNTYWTRAHKAFPMI
jgi:immune inhibitor A